MKPFKLRHKITAISLAMLFFLLSLSNINEHTYTIGFDNFHSESFGCCIISSNVFHSSYNCGKPFHF